MFALISQYQETPADNRSDFYRFLYNRSKIKPLTHYFGTGKKIDTSKKLIPTRKSYPESKKTPEEKSRFNFDFQQHASLAKQKEDQLEQRIGQWLERVENGTDVVPNIATDMGESSKMNAMSLKEEVTMQVEDEDRKAEESAKRTDVTESDQLISPSHKKKKLTFGELFGEKTYDNSPKERVSTLDTLDKLLLEEVAKEASQNNDSIEIDARVEKPDPKRFKGQLNSPIFSKSTQNSKKDSQLKIHDFFKKQNT